MIRWVLEAMKLYLEMFVKNPEPIENYSPYQIRQFLIKVLTVKNWANSEKYNNVILLQKYSTEFLDFNIFSFNDSLTVLGRRKIEGSLCRVPTHFYNQVWEVLMRCPGGICVNGRVLPQQPTLSNMTRSELTFALLVESLLHHIQLPEYRQIIVEVTFN